VKSKTPPTTSLQAADIAAAAQLACLLEVSAPKPGNVSPGRHFADARYEDFLASAAAIGGPLSAAGTQPIGVTILLSIAATARRVRSNTNLGIVLLLAPLARAADLARLELGISGAVGSTDFARILRGSVQSVLEATTVDDARNVYTAIRLAAPGGLGQVPAEDVAGEPTVTLLEAMRLAADRDAIAREYATGFEITFERGVPALERARRDKLSWDDAVVETYLTLLAAGPDTHILRRAGLPLATEVSQLAQRALAAGGVRSPAGRDAIEVMDRTLRDPHHTANPGTTADLTAAAIFVVLLRG